MTLPTLASLADPDVCGWEVKDERQRLISA